MKAFIAFARNIPRAADQIRVNLQTPLPVSYIDYGTAGFTGLADYFTGDAKAAFAEVKDPALQKQFDEAAGEASTSMTALADWLAKQRKDATQDSALGPHSPARMLQTTALAPGPNSTLDKTAPAAM